MKLERVEKLNLTLSAGAVAATWAFASPHVATSLTLGAALEAMNFGALHRSAQLYVGSGVRGAGPWLAVFSTRFVLLAGGILIAMMYGAHPVALVCGLSIAMPAVLIDAWWHRAEYDPAAQQDWDVPPPDDESWDRYSIWRPWDDGEPAGANDGELEQEDGDEPGRATMMADASDAIASTMGVDLTADLAPREQDARVERAERDDGRAERARDRETQ